MPAQETRSVGGFHEIQAVGQYDLDLTMGASGGVTVSGDSNLVPLVQTRADGTTLYVSQVGSFETSTPLVVTVVLPQLDALSFDGTSRVRIHPFQGDTLHFAASGAVFASAENLQYAHLSVALRDTASLNLAGSSMDLQIQVSDRSEVNGDTFTAATASLQAGETTQVMLGACGSLSGMLTDVANVDYAGTCASAANLRVSGPATFRCQR